MHKFDYTFLKEDAITPTLSNSIFTLGKIQGILDGYKKNNPEYLNNLREQSIIRSTEASNVIEGISASKDRLNLLLLGVLPPKSNNEFELLGYSKALREIHLNYEKLDCTRETLLKLHSIMMSTTLGGKNGFKQTDNLIISTVQGVNSVVFKPVSAKDVEFAVEQWELAISKAWNDSQINKLLLIPCIVADFLCIHPFSDGNGRVSRLLSVLLLYKAGYSVAAYFSFEEQINEDREFYYASLREVSDSWYNSRTDYESFTLQFLVSLYGCYRQLPDEFL